MESYVHTCFPKIDGTSEKETCFDVQSSWLKKSYSMNLQMLKCWVFNELHSLFYWTSLPFNQEIVHFSKGAMAVYGLVCQPAERYLGQSKAKIQLSLGLLANPYTGHRARNWWTCFLLLTSPVFVFVLFRCFFSDCSVWIFPSVLKWKFSLKTLPLPSSA